LGPLVRQPLSAILSSPVTRCSPAAGRAWRRSGPAWRGRVVGGDAGL